MAPDERVDEEIRGHLAINIKERIERGEDPVSARRAALMEFGYVPAVRDEMRRVWYSRGYDEDETEAFVRDVRFALRSLARAKTLTLSVVVTLALGIGANAAIFSVVRSVLIHPLVNRDADRLVYIRQTAPGIGTENIRLAVGSTPRNLRNGVLRDGVRIAALGIAAGAAGEYALVRVVEGFVGNVGLPGALPVMGAAAVLFAAAIVASLMPATRAARVDVLQALRSE